MLFGDVDQRRFWKRGHKMDVTRRWDRAKAIPGVLYHWEGMTGGSGDDGLGMAATTSYDFADCLVVSPSADVRDGRQTDRT